MSAAEIIEQIKTLPREEQLAVATFVKAAVLERGAESDAGTRYVAPERARELSAQIFSENAELFRKLAQ